MSDVIDQIADQIFTRQIGIVTRQIDSAAAYGHNITCYRENGSFGVIWDGIDTTYECSHLDNAAMAVLSNQIGELLIREAKSA